MDFKGKWVGNIYQRFATMCQDGDDFVSKEAVKHVQNADESVKKLYSGVVEDEIPPLADPDENDMSVIGIEKNSVEIDTKESSTNEIPHEELTLPENENPTDQCSDSKTIDENYINGTQTMVPISGESSMSPGKKPRKINKRTIPGVNRADHKVTETQADSPLVPIATIIDDLGRRSYQEEELSWSWPSDSDDENYENEEGGAENYVDSGVTVDEKLMGERAEIMSKASLCSEFGDENPKDTLAKVSLSTLVDASGIRSSHSLDEVEDDTNTSSSLRKFELAFSAVYCDSKFDSYKNTPPTKSNNLPDVSDANCLREADTTCCDSTPKLSASFQDLNFNDKEADVSSSSVLSLQSDDVNTTIRSDEALPAAETSGIKHEQCYGFVPFEISMYSLELGMEDCSAIDVADPSLETIDLSDKGTLDESWGLVMEDNSVNAYSFRARRQRSYKEIIKDAFTSKKKLTKEYKQLGLLHGDIDKETSSYPWQGASSSNSTTHLESKKSQTQDLRDSEWELL